MTGALILSFSLPRRWHWGSLFHCAWSPPSTSEKLQFQNTYSVIVKNGK